MKSVATYTFLLLALSLLHTTVAAPAAELRSVQIKVNRLAGHSSGSVDYDIAEDPANDDTAAQVKEKRLTVHNFGTYGIAEDPANDDTTAQVKEKRLTVHNFGTYGIAEDPVEGITSRDTPESM